MKKVLILAYDFPPYVSVGGLRPYNWYKYFKDFDIEPVVVTRQWENKHKNHLDYISESKTDKIVYEKDEYGLIIRAPYFQNISNRLLQEYGSEKFKLLRKTITASLEVGQFFFSVGTKFQLYKAANEYLKLNKVDLIIATGDPFILFRYASLLSSKYNIPWIADYRDPWTYNSEQSKSYFQLLYTSYLEKKYTSTASNITTVSTFVKSKIEKVLTNVPFTILPNGYDPDAIALTSNVPQNQEILTFSFVGTIYNWHPLESILRTFDKILKNNPQIKLKLKFYGINCEDKITNLLDTKYSYLKECCYIIPKLPNIDLLNSLAKDNVMLLFNYYSYMGTKIFDYIGIKRQIILCYTDDVEAKELKKRYYNVVESETESTELQADLIKETNSGVLVKDSDHLEKLIVQLFNEFQINKEIKCSSVHVESLSRKVQISQLAKLINDILCKK